MKALRLFLIVLAAIVPSVSRAADPDPWENYDEAMFMDMDFDANIASPALSSDKERRAVRRYIGELGKRVAEKGYIVETDRDDEVMVVTIPLEKLFLPNDTLLRAGFEKTLRPLIGFLKDPGMFKVVYAVHSDNTGSENYNYDLSNERVASIYDWLLDNISEDLIVIPFAMGDTDPIGSNLTRDGRRQNRRLEIFFVPGPELILRARKGKI